MGAGKESVMDNNSRPAREQVSQDHSGIQGERQGSRGQNDLNSEEEAVEAANVPGKHVACSCGDQVPKSPRQSTDFQRQRAPGRVPGMNGMLAPGRSREMLDPDSLEDNFGGPAAVGNSRLTDYDGKTTFYITENKT